MTKNDANSREAIDVEEIICSNAPLCHTSRRHITTPSLCSCVIGLLARLAGALYECVSACLFN